MVGSYKDGRQRSYRGPGCTLKREGRRKNKGERGATVIPAGHGPIPRVAMLSKAHKDPKGTPPDSPRKRALGEGRQEGKGAKRGSTDKHEVVQHTLTQGGGRHVQLKEERQRGIYTQNGVIPSLKKESVLVSCRQTGREMMKRNLPQVHKE